MRSRKAARLFDRYAASVHTVATVLTKAPDHADALVVTAICSRSTTPLAKPDSMTSPLGQLAAAAYTAWSCQPAPHGSVIAQAGFKPRLPMLSAVHQLPDDHRAALALCAFGSHTYRQAAAALGLDDQEVTQLLREALLTLSSAAPTSN